MERDIKILQLCSYYVTTRLYQNLFDALERLHVKQDVYVSIDRSHKIQGDYPANVRFAKCYNKWDRLVFHRKHSKVLKDVVNVMKVNEYDVIHAHSLFSNGYIAYELNQIYNTPYIVAVRNTDVNVFFKRMIHLRKMGVNILRNAARIVFISEPYLRYTIDRFVPEQEKRAIIDKSIVIPNGIDAFWLQNPFAKKRKPRASELRLLYVGKIDANKNIETTAKACELLLEQGYDIKYTIIGEIKNRRYRRFIGDRRFIDYLPYCEMKELVDHYRAADIFVMPSKHETFGLVYAEAMSQGLPIIYTRGQGFDGQFDEGEVGYSVQYDSPMEIAAKVKDILMKYETISANCIKKSRRFDWDEIGKEYERLYEEIL